MLISGGVAPLRGRVKGFTPVIVSGVIVPKIGVEGILRVGRVGFGVVGSKGGVRFVP